MEGGRAYWDGIAADDDGLPAAWRHQARVEHLELVRRWVGVPSGRWLKTDLFEEHQPARSLVPQLPTATWVGMDLSAEVLRRGGAAVGGRVVACDARALAVASGAFDGVLSTSTLDHFADAADIDRSLRELRRVLRPGGVLVLTLDNRANPLIRLRNALPRRLAQRTGLVPYEVGVTLDATELRAATTRAGFEVQACEHLLHVPHVVGTRASAWAPFARHVLPRFQRLARTPMARWSGHYVAVLARVTGP